MVDGIEKGANEKQESLETIRNGIIEMADAKKEFLNPVLEGINADEACQYVESLKSDPYLSKKDSEFKSYKSNRKSFAYMRPWASVGTLEYDDNSSFFIMHIKDVGDILIAPFDLTEGEGSKIVFLARKLTGKEQMDISDSENYNPPVYPNWPR